MEVRGLGLVAVVAALGLAGGYAYADRTDAAPTGEGVPAPVVASGPAYPYTPPEVVKRDSDIAPLSTDPETTTVELGRPPAGVELPIPVGWPKSPISEARLTPEARWTAPGNPPGSYSVRIAVLNERQTVYQQVLGLGAQLHGDTRITSLEILGQTDDTLTFTYVLFGYRIEQVVRWVSLTGGKADVEIAASGRLIDEPGMQALVDRIAAGVRRLPPKSPTTKESPTSSASATTS